jgi:predicted XRE-type DNA-binding protein
MPEKIKVETSSGNVFADIGVAEPDLALAKAELASQIDRVIRARRLKQVQVAEILGVDQGKVSALVRGRLAGFSTERLFRFLNALGRDVKIVVTETPRSRKRSRLTVVTSS